MTADPVILIIGAGPRVGASVAQTFASNGYKVAVASRKGRGGRTAEGFLSLKADLANPSSISTLFETVKTEFKSYPSVVVYNAAATTPPPDKESVLSVSDQSVTNDLIVNTVSPYVAAQLAIKGWEASPNETKKTFIYTGNIQNVAVVPVPMMLDLGMGKAASAYWIGTADATYSTKGYRFFYADERQYDGKMKGMALDGAAHGEFFALLAKQEVKVPWCATFVKGKGYVKF
ncbi:hypothetical protein B0A55_07754 [Friedmanniomyces simplex]|uniref:NAD(P)-binding protein n=1 Tax=Friedmanniomyces simplex TaxID=329884 RepID=A0A4U0X956_9PEZI|nr:hypothetical protein B0A55_07754 [Friedmanniomyces simplex]